MDNCCDSLLKYLLFIFSFILFASGIALIGLGTYMKVAMDDYLNFLDDAYLNSSVLFIVLGVIILIVGFFGCCGACTENACMMFVFSTFLAIIVAVEIGGAIAIYVFRGDTHDAIIAKMVDGMDNYSRDPNSDFGGVTATWDAMQKDLKCCGVNRYTDWKNSTFGKKTGAVPDSCCINEVQDCGANAFGQGSDITNRINTDGCLKKLEEFVRENVATVGAIIIVIIVLQIVGVLVSCMLANNMRKRKNYV